MVTQSPFARKSSNMLSATPRDQKKASAAKPSASSPSNNYNCAKRVSVASTSLIMSPSSPPSPLGKRRHDDISENPENNSSICSRRTTMDKFEPRNKRQRGSKDDTKSSSRVRHHISKRCSKCHKCPKSKSRVRNDITVKRPMLDASVDILTYRLHNLHISGPIERHYRQARKNSDNIKSIFGVSICTSKVHSSDKVKVNATSSVSSAGNASITSNVKATSNGRTRINTNVNSTRNTDSQRGLDSCAQPLSSKENDAVQSKPKSIQEDTAPTVLISGHVSISGHVFTVMTGHSKPNQEAVLVVSKRGRRRGTANTDRHDKLKVIDEQRDKSVPNHRHATPAKSHLKIKKPRPGQPHAPKRKITFGDNIRVTVENTHYPQEGDNMNVEERKRQKREMIKANQEARRAEWAIAAYVRAQREQGLSGETIRGLNQSEPNATKLADVVLEQRLNRAAHEMEDYESTYLDLLETWKVGYERRVGGRPTGFPVVLIANHKSEVRRVALARCKELSERTGRHF